MRSSLVCIGLTTVVLTGACVSTAPKQALQYPEPLPPLQVNFTYAQQKAQIKSISANIGIVELRTDNEIDCPGNGDAFQRVVREYVQSLNSDFLGALMAKGYTVTGPFPNRNEITYADKEKAVLMLEPTLHLTVHCDTDAGTIFSQGEVGTSNGKDALGNPVIVHDEAVISKHSGTLTANATIDLMAFEPLTGEKMWIKSIKVPVKPQAYDLYMVTRRSFYAVGSLGDVLFGTTRKVPVGQPTQTIIAKSDGRPSALAHQLESVYVAELNQFNKYFDPDEIAQVIKDAQKIRKLKRY